MLELSTEEEFALTFANSGRDGFASGSVLQADSTITFSGNTGVLAQDSIGFVEDTLSFEHAGEFQIEGGSCCCCGAMLSTSQIDLDSISRALNGELELDVPFSEITAPEPPVASMFSGQFDFSVNVTNNSGDAMFDDFISDVMLVTEKALSLWGQFIVGATGSSIEVEVSIEDFGSETAVARAGAGTLTFEEELADGTFIFTPGTQRELTTGTDPNDTDSDLNVDVNTGFLTGSSAFFETDDNRDPPSGAIDFVSVLAHEIGHGLGFAGFFEADGIPPSQDFGPPFGVREFGTTYDKFIEFDANGVPFFTGQNTVDLYGEKVALEFQRGPGSDISHFSGEVIDQTPDVPFDMRLALMNPSVVSGDVTTIGMAELAVLNDIGYNITIPSDLDYINRFDDMAVTPELSLAAATTISADGLMLTLNADQESSFVNVDSSLGYRITNEAGTGTVSGRAVVGANDLSGTEVVDIRQVLTVDGGTGIINFAGGSFNVDLFNPAQATLPNGTNLQTFSITIGAVIFGSEEDDTLSGDSAANNIFGDAGDDMIRGSGGGDNIDGGSGTDWVVFDDAGAGVTVDLEAGTGTVGGNQDTYTNIENVIGSNFNDTIQGISAGTVFDGGAGDDALTGLGGNDRFLGGAGADSHTGGAGIDEVNYVAAAAGVTLSLTAGTGSAGDAAGDTFNGVENIVGSDFIDDITGDDLANTITGNGGDDIINAGNGQDTVFGNDGADTVLGGAGADEIFGGAGNDNLTGNGARDRIFGEAGEDFLSGGGERDFLDGGINNDTIIGGDSADTIVGGDGDDLIEGRRGSDNIDAGDGNDTIIGNGLKDTVIGGLGNDIIRGGGGSDVLNGNEGDDEIVGGAGADSIDGGTDNDTISGGGGNDNILGGAGDDIILGGGGSDTLSGGAGTDSLTGNASTDTFVFAAGHEMVTIIDFRDNQDILDLTDFAFNDVSEATALMTEDSGNVTFALNSDMLVINNITIAELTDDISI